MTALSILRRVVFASLLVVTAVPSCDAAPGQAKSARANCPTRFGMSRVGAALVSDSDAIVIGEVHGNVEAPAAFYELVCDATLVKGRTVTIGVELPEDAISIARAAAKKSKQPAAASVHLGTRGFWPEARDGRSSRAQFELLLKLFALEESGRLKVVGFDRRGIESRDFGDAAADYLAANAKPGARRIFLVLVGRGHAQFNGSPISLVDALAKRQIRTSAVSLSYSGGRSWVCQESCGPSDVPPQPDCKPLQFGGMSQVDAYRARGGYCLGAASVSPPTTDSRP